MDRQVLSHMGGATEYFVDLEELNRSCGTYIAGLLGAPAACITSGAAAGIAISTAACIAGSDAEQIIRLPESSHKRTICLSFKSHWTPFMQSVGMAGGHLILLDGDKETLEHKLSDALDDSVALFLYIYESGDLHDSLPLSTVAHMTRAHNIPLIVDGAGELPPQSFIKSCFEDGADVVLLSGGKELRGPQASGLILGSKKFVECCIANNCPHHSIGRAMKIDKEHIVGLVKAVEFFVQKDYSEMNKVWDTYVEKILMVCSRTEHLHAHRGFPSGPGIRPIAIPRVYLSNDRLDAETCAKRLKDGPYHILTAVEGTHIVINPQCLSKKEVGIIIRALKEIDSSS
jgi:L-seryl-tRNA(Ser) seleniumtransferase